jgi:hypothetical protein
MGSNKNQIIWTDFTFSGLPLALPGFSDDGLRFGFQGCLDEGSSGYGLKTGLTVWIWVFKVRMRIFWIGFSRMTWIAILDLDVWFFRFGHCRLLIQRCKRVREEENFFD